MIKVVIADDIIILRESIKYMLESDPDIKVVGTAGDGFEACIMCESLKPDIVLMDIMMPGCNGIEATKIIKEKYSNVKVVILSTFGDDENVKHSIKSGALGYVLKDADPKDLIEIVKNVSKGYSIIHQNVMESISRNIPEESDLVSSEDERKKYRLTNRELTILKLIVDGKSNKEIASEIFITEGALRNAVSEILRKLNLRDRIQLAVFAVKNHLV